MKDNSLETLEKKVNEALAGINAIDTMTNMDIDEILNS